jgi:hypothetical protein
LCYLVESGFLGFGGQKSHSKPEDFLPFKFDDDSGFVLSEQTIAIFKEIIEDHLLPPEIIADFYSIDKLSRAIDLY